jgi:hypothetical protein
VTSYDGQATNQRGIHSRFENDLVLRNITKLKLSPVVTRPVPNVKDFIFEALISGEALVETILAADSRANRQSRVLRRCVLRGVPERHAAHRRAQD